MGGLMQSMGFAIETTHNKEDSHTVTQLNLTKDVILSSLEQNYYVNVPVDLSFETLDEAIAAFYKFLDQPDDIKLKIGYKIAGNHRRGEVGLTHRDPHDALTHDSKDFFHFHPTLFDRYSDFLAKNPIVNDFMMKANHIWNTAYSTVSNIMKTLEPEFPGIHDQIFDTEEVHIILRFLRYDWKESKKNLAKGHFDAGACTLAIGESRPGLRMGSNDQDLKPIVHESGNAVFFLASNLRNIIKQKSLNPAWHDVIQMDDTCIGKSLSRWAIVAFIDAHGVDALPWEETHKFYVPEGK